LASQGDGSTFLNEYKPLFRETTMRNPTKAEIAIMMKKQFMPYESIRWLTYEQARVIVSEYHITTPTQFKNWKLRPDNIPSDPEKIYPEWISWSHFLDIDMNTYKETISTVHNIGFKMPDNFKKQEILPHQERTETSFSDLCSNSFGGKSK
jgi:hypothetical protein